MKQALKDPLDLKALKDLLDCPVLLAKTVATDWMALRAKMDSPDPLDCLVKQKLVEFIDEK